MSLCAGRHIHTVVPLLLLPVFCEKAEGILENLIGFSQFGIFFHQPALILVQRRIAADAAADKSGKANERYYELWLNNSEKEAWNGKTITVDFTNLQADKEKLYMYNVVKGNWKLTWPLSYADKTRTFAVNRSYTINGHAVLVKSVELSPLSMTLDLGGDGLKQLLADSGLRECGGLLTCSLNCKDGSSFTEFDGSKHENPAEILPGSVKWTDRLYPCQPVWQDPEILNMDEVSSLTLTFPLEKADNTLTIALA